MSLYENDGKGVFADMSDSAGISVPKEYYGFTPLTTDFDNDGWTDVYVACDSTASLLYHNQKDGTFEEVGVISGTAYNLDGMEQAGMGVTAGDYDGDGDLDLFKTNFSSDTHTLYRNEGEMFFSDETIRTGLAVNTQYLGWGTAFVDVDHDGWKDIFVANGHVLSGYRRHSSLRNLPATKTSVLESQGWGIPRCVRRGRSGDRRGALFARNGHWRPRQRREPGNRHRQHARGAVSVEERWRAGRRVTGASPHPRGA